MDIAAGARKINPLIGGWSRADWIFYFLAIPAALIAVFFLPSSLKQYLILQPQAPTILSVFANHYTHTDLMHITSNLVFYLLAVFLIFNLEVDKKRFRWISAMFFLLLPFVVSLIVIRLLPMLPPIQGFSAIDAAFTGYLLYATYAYLKNRFSYIRFNFLSLLMIANFALLCILNNYGVPLIGLTLTSLLVLVVLERHSLVTLSKALFESYRSIPRKAIVELEYKLGVFAFTGCLVILLPLLVPLNILEGNAIVNSVAHYIGWVLGLFIPIAIDCTEYIRNLFRKPVS